MQQRLQEWIEHPELLNSDTLYELRRLLVQYPYFQTAHLLYLKNLYLLQDTSFRDELRKSALFIADVSVLFYYIEGERLSLKRDSSPAESEEDTSADRTLVLIDRFLSGMPSQSQPRELPVTPEVVLDYTSVLEQESEEDDAETIPMKGQDLIDSFIEGTEELRQEEESKSEEANEVEVPDETDGESYFTETLAKIYVKQQRYDKALEIIKKLYLKYPKKNLYFADQIRFLEKLIINAKSK